MKKSNLMPNVRAEFTPAPKGVTYSIAGKEYPVTGYYNFQGEMIPLVDIPMVSDYKWQSDCLKDRLEHPEKYRDSEDVEATIEHLKKWLAEHEYMKG